MISKFGNVEKQIKSGDLLAFKTADFLSELVEHWTASEYAHAGLAWVHYGSVFVLECAVGAGVRIRALSQAVPCDWITTNLHWNDNAETLAFRDYGKPYNFMADLEIALDQTPPEGAEVCTMFCADLLGKLGVPVIRQGLTPGKLVNIMLLRGGNLQTLTA